MKRPDIASAAATRSGKKYFWLCDLLFFCFAAAFACLAFEGIIPVSGNGAVMDSDLMTYAQGMAGEQHRELFAADPVLHTQSAANSIKNLERIAASLLAQGDSWPRGLLAAGCMAIFVFYLGWYIFGRFLYRSPCLAAMLSLACAITVWVGWGTFWGVNHSDPVPRVFFAALMPFLLLGGVLAMTRSWLRPLLMAACGLMMWVHGVSALNCGAMLFMAFFCNPVPAGTWRGQIANLLLCLAAFLVPVLIFLWPSLQQPRSFTQEELEIFHQLMALRWREDYADFGKRMLVFFSPAGPVFPILAGGVAGALAAIWRGSNRERLFCRMAWPAALALLIVAAFCWCETNYAPALGRLPMGHELVRGMRFFVPIGWILIFAGIGCLCGIWLRRLCLVILIGCWLGLSTDRQLAAVEYAIAAKTNIPLPLAKNAAEQKDMADQYRALYEAVASIVPQGEAIYAPRDAMPVRYLSLRPLAHSFKDGYVHFYNKDLEAARRWLRLEQLAQNQLDQNQQKGWLAAWRESAAPWALVPESMLPESMRPKAGGSDNAIAGDIVLARAGWLLLQRK